MFCVLKDLGIKSYGIYNLFLNRLVIIIIKIIISVKREREKVSMVIIIGEGILVKGI